MDQAAIDAAALAIADAHGCHTMVLYGSRALVSRPESGVPLAADPRRRRPPRLRDSDATGRRSQRAGRARGCDLRPAACCRTRWWRVNAVGALFLIATAAGAAAETIPVP